MFLPKRSFVICSAFVLVNVCGFLDINASAQSPTGVVFSDGTGPPPGGGSYPIDLETIATAINNTDTGTFGSAASDSITAYNDDANTDPAFNLDEGVTITQSYSGPRPGNSIPGLSKTISITTRHQAVDTVTTENATLSSQAPVFVGAASTSFSSHATTISNEDSPTAKLAGRKLTIHFSSTASYRELGFLRVPTLQIYCDFLKIDVNTQNGDDAAPTGGFGLLAYDPRTGAVIAQDMSFANPNSTAPSTTEFTYVVYLPDVHSMTFNVTSISTLGSGFFNGSDLVVLGPNDRADQLPGFDWSVSYELSD